MITALKNLKTAITSRPSVPLENHTIYNHDSDSYNISTSPADVNYCNGNFNNPYYVHKDNELVPYKFTTKEA